MPHLRQLWAPGTALFLLLVGWYVLTMSGHTYSSDEETMLAVADSLSLTRSFAIPADDLFLMNFKAGEDGRIYSRYGPAQSLVAVPFVMVGQAIGAQAPLFSRMIERIFVLLLPAIITALTALLLYAWARAIGYSTRVSLAVGLLYGLTSLAWPHGRTFFAEPLSTFFLVLSAYGMRREQRLWWVIGGFAVGGALATKFQTAIAVPLLVIYVLLVCWEGDVRSFGRSLAGRVSFGLLGLAVPLGLLLLYDTQIFGAPLNTGYGSVGGSQVAGLLTGQWQDRVYALTIGAGKGLLAYSPTIALGIIGLASRLRQQWRESLLAVGMLAVHLAFYSRISSWHGDGSWGPRFLVFVLPFAYLPAAGLVAALSERRGRGVRALIGGLVVLSFAIQLLPVLINFNVYLNFSVPNERYFNPAASPIVWQGRLWSDRVARWWSGVFMPSGTAILRDGFSYSEGDRSKGELLPRWTYGDGQIDLHPTASGPIDVRIVVGDHRPWPLPRADFTLLLDGKPVEGVRRTDLTGQQIQWELSVQIPAQHVHDGMQLDLHSDTWNPHRTTPENPRDEDVGLMLETADLKQAGQRLQLKEAVAIPSRPPGRAGVWFWYQDASIHSLFDWWVWYVLIGNVPRRIKTLLFLMIASPALLSLMVGLCGIIMALGSARSRLWTVKRHVQTEP